MNGSQFMESKGFSQLPLRHLWNFGNNVCAILKILTALPPHLGMCIRRLAYLLEMLAEQSSVRLKDNFLLTGCKGCVPASFFSRPDITVTWDAWDDLGFIIVSYDPQSQSRQNFAANRRAARFLGLTKSEITEKFVQGNVPLLMTELDWIRAFAVYLARYFDDTVVQYVRFTTKSENQTMGSSSPMHLLEGRLVCIETTKCFDAFGRIAQVPCNVA